MTAGALAPLGMPLTVTVNVNDTVSPSVTCTEPLAGEIELRQCRRRRSDGRWSRATRPRLRTATAASGQDKQARRRDVTSRRCEVHREYPFVVS